MMKIDTIKTPFTLYIHIHMYICVHTCTYIICMHTHLAMPPTFLRSGVKECSWITPEKFLPPPYLPQDENNYAALKYSEFLPYTCTYTLLQLPDQCHHSRRMSNKLGHTPLHSGHLHIHTIAVSRCYLQHGTTHKLNSNYITGYQISLFSRFIRMYIVQV